MRNSRLKRFTVPLESQGEFESVRLWRHVSKAIGEDDQVGATEEKSKLEEEQRAGARERKATGEEWVPRLFETESTWEQYEYRHADLRPWDDLNDQHQFERGFVVCTKTRHKTPMIRKALAKQSKLKSQNIDRVLQLQDSEHRERERTRRQQGLAEERRRRCQRGEGNARQVDQGAEEEEGLLHQHGRGKAGPTGNYLL